MTFHRFTAVAALLAGCQATPPPSTAAPLSSSASSAAATGDPGPATTPLPTASAVDPVSSANAFGADLYGQLRAAKGNLVCSPLSITLALAMTRDGARGATEGAIRRVLHADGIGPGRFGELGARLAAPASAGASDGPTLRIADRLWADARAKPLPAFVELVRTAYGAPLEVADFGADAEAARVKINGWVARETSDKIKSLLPAGSLDASTRLVLVNAVYFKGAWSAKLDPKATRPASFFVDGATPRDVPTMHATLAAAYAETPSAQVLELPYAGAKAGGPALVMDIVLPKERQGLGAVEDAFVKGGLAGFVGSLAPRDHIALSLPRAKLSSAFDLAAGLGALGMGVAFGAAADFSGMSTSEPLYLSKAVHQAFVDINEEGTEAAAATGVVMVPKALVRGPVFNADHPFLFAIRDAASGAILFVGRVVDPG